ELRRAAVAHGDVEMAVVVEDEARAKMGVALHLRFLAEDHFDLFQRGAVFAQLATSNGRAVAAIAGLGEAQINQTIFGKGRVKGDVEQAALAARIYFRNAGNRV